MIDLLAFNLLTAILAVLAAAALRIRPLRLWPVAAITLQILLIQTWVLATGVLGRLNLTAWRTLAPALLVVALLGLRSEPLRRELRLLARRARRTAAVIGPLRLSAAATALLGCTAAIFTLGMLVGPYMPDLISYHLAPPTDWIMAGKIADRPWLDSRSWWPQGQGLLAAWWMLPVRSLRASILANLHAVALAAAVSWAWARQMGLDRRWALLASMMPLTLPIVWAQGSSGLNDLPIAMLMLGAVAPLIRRRVSPQGLALAAAMLLIALGMKATPLPMLPPIALLWLWRAGAEIHRRIAEAQRKKEKSQPDHSACLLCASAPLRFNSVFCAWAVLLGAAMVLGSCWYVRNAAVWGNPLYPTTVNAGPVHLRGDPELEKYVGHFRLHNLRLNLPDFLLHRMWDDAKPVMRADVVKGSGFGPVAAGLGAAALVAVVAMARAGRGRAAVVALLGSTLLMLASVEHDDWFGRFLMHLALMMAIATVVVAARIGEGWLRRVWLGMLGAAAAAGVAAGAGSTVPLLVRTYWKQAGVCAVPAAVPIAVTDQGWTAQASEKLPLHEPLVVFAPTHNAPVALLHGPRLTRPLIYADRLPDVEQMRRWRAAGARLLLASVPTSEMMWAHEKLSTIGFRRISEGVYEIP